MILAQILFFPGMRTDCIFSRYSPGFYLFPVLGWILPFFGTHTDSTLFRYSSGQFFDTRTDSTFSRYSPEYCHFLVLTQIRPFSDTLRECFSILARFHLYTVLARIQLIFGTRKDSTIFGYSSGQFFDTRTDSTFSRYLPEYCHF